eukprot:scaffold252886_cov12-Tisochrysis_lutea.AAC.1
MLLPSKTWSQANIVKKENKSICHPRGRFINKDTAFIGVAMVIVTGWTDEGRPKMNLMKVNLNPAGLLKF